MAVKKKSNYIEEDLDWLEKQAQAIKDKVDSLPYNEITDRIIWLEGPKGPVETVVQKKEAIEDAHRKSLKDYFELIAAVGTKRTEEEKKKEFARGGHEVPHRMK